jgi:hypothetical protein
MNREKFPERVPFRLTRMMIKAMEVSGIEGNFRWVGVGVGGRRAGGPWTAAASAQLRTLQSRCVRTCALRCAALHQSLLPGSGQDHCHRRARL